MYGPTMAGHNGHGGRSSGHISSKTIRTADVEREQAAREAALRGTPELQAALHPGGLFRLTRDVRLTSKMGEFDVLGPAPAGGVTALGIPPTMRKGSILMMVRAERVSVKTNSGFLRKPCYTFLIMGASKRCVLAELSLVEPC